ncbi:MAG: rod shape-determining protein MreD [Clostridia bacterium]|nr:rod shape-determining protein MreD [Clostridia bacterium]
MKIKIFAYTICIFAIILMQSTVFEYVRIYNVKPNLFIVFIVSIALLRGNVEGAVVGFFAGLSQDIMSGKLLGFYSLLGLYLGLLLGSVNKRLYRENILVVIFFTFISTVAYEVVVCVFGLLFITEVDIVYAMKNIILLEALYNCLAAIFIYIIAVKLNHKFEAANSSKRKY